MGTLVITASNGFESLLTGSIPNLELNGLAINVNCSNFEVNTNGWHEIIIENIILYQTNNQIRCLLGCIWAKILTANLRRREDFPTPELPISSTLKR